MKVDSLKYNIERMKRMTRFSNMPIVPTWQGNYGNGSDKEIHREALKKAKGN